MTSRNVGTFVLEITRSKAGNVELVETIMNHENDLKSLRLCL